MTSISQGAGSRRSSDSGGEGLFRYDFHGHEVESEFPLDLVERDPRSPCVGTLAIRRAAAAPEAAPAVWRSGVTSFILSVSRAGWALVGAPGSLLITDDSIDVWCDELVPELQAYLLGPAAALWLERKGTPVLHAACVEIGSTAVALTARSGGGKSCLAAALLGRGARLLCDDVVPIAAAPPGSFSVFRGRLGVRLWPDAARVWADPRELTRVAPGIEKRVLRPGKDLDWSAARGPFPLGAIVVLQRARGGPVQLDRLDSADALAAVLAGGFVAEPAEAAGLAVSRLSSLAAVVREVSVFRLRYGSDLHRLDDVAAVVATCVTEPPRGDATDRT